jgi:hypothetical protein
MNRIVKSPLFSLSALLVFSFMISSCSSSRRSIAIEQGWEMLGESKVNFVSDNDEIKVFNENKFTALRFRVEDREIHIHEVKISFSNGDKLEPAIDEVIQPDQYSRYIELGAEGRVIRSIQFRYRTTGTILKGRADVLVLGRRYDPYNNPVPLQ